MKHHEIKKGYESWCAARDWSLGPSIRSRIENQQLFDEADRQIGELGLTAQLEMSSSGTILEVESPWHAAVFLFRSQSTFIRSNKSHMIFRGQQRSSWGLETTIDRLKDHQDAHTRALVESVVFCTMMKNLHTDFASFSPNQEWSFELVLPLMAYFPVAQHHGIPTPFLDFTADPAVAVFFASRDESDSDETASIFCYRFPLEGERSELFNMRFVPPFVERPYLQKGIFVETTYQGDIKDKIPPDLEVRFPVRAFNHEFSVFRESLTDILPDDDEEILLLKSYAKAGVSDFIIEHRGQYVTAENIGNFADEYCRRNERILKSIYKQEVADPIGLAARYVDAFEDMMYWFCYHPHDDGLGVNFETLSIIVRSNPEIVKMVISFYRWMNGMPREITHRSDAERNFKGQLIMHLHEELRKAGVDPNAPAGIEKWLPKP